ncbi:hypothetical protein M422DRAFT_261622 [Sphaerobolus stellatus SS14]|uniref:Myb/SANT-like domain-containing protein n=1 Tax=Sphaerobolus stellatus (strain SS14) TaxID=990650 RepID=A0A0C9UMJ7_SPHS4|nr:hypothetical protein M422DRAFT_261622 [Sphaerobolus stellatus SS14]
MAKISGKQPEKDSKAIKTQKRAPNTVWSDAEDQKWVECLLDEQAQGLQGENGWKMATWVRILAKLQEAFPESSKNKTAIKLKTRHERVKGDYKQVKDLRETSGFGWDESKQAVTATDEVWELLLQRDLSLSKWKEKSFPLYDQMAKLCGDMIATGSNVFRGGALTALGANSMTSEGADVETEDEDEDEDGVKTPAPRKKWPYKSSSPGVAPSAKKKGCTSGVDAIMHLAGTVVKVGARLASPEPGEQGGLKPSPVCHTTAYQVAEEEEELSDNSLVRVMKVFQGSTEHADAYLAFKCKGAHCLWLQSLLDEQL